MILRTKTGELLTLAGRDLLSFLGVKKDARGIQKVPENVELIAAVPFALAFCEKGGNAEQSAQGYPWVLSTYDLDCYRERIDPMGWDFERYAKNPVVEWAHRYDIPAIGRIEGLRADGKGLHGTVHFNGKSYDPFGWSIGERVKAGVLRAGSVGFRAIEIEIPAKGGMDDAALVFRKQELLEFSICNVPANPFALAKASSAYKHETEGAQPLELPRFWGNIFCITGAET